jgi:hypothetical protein
MSNIADNQMQEGLRIILLQDTIEGDAVFKDLHILRGASLRNEHLWLLAHAFDGTKDYVLLKYLIVAEGLVTSLEKAEVGEADMAKEMPSEGKEVGAVTEASGGDSDELSAIVQQKQRKRNKCRVEIASLDSQPVQKSAIWRIASELFVRWVDNRHVEFACLDPEKVSIE